MNELIARMQPGEFIGLVAIIGGIIAGISVPTVFGITIFMRNSRRDSMEYDLKQDMLARGMNADDIERVIRVGVVENEQPLWKQWGKAANSWSCSTGESVGMKS